MAQVTNEYFIIYCRKVYIFMGKTHTKFEKKSTNDVKGKNPLNSDDTERD